MEFPWSHFNVFMQGLSEYGNVLCSVLTEFVDLAVLQVSDFILVFFLVIT